MLLHISEQSAETLQEQIIRQIRALILSGNLVSNSPLPSIRSLSKELRVSVITIQRAYEQLLREELVYARRGKGFFVASILAEDMSAVARKRFREQLLPLLVNAKRDGLDTASIEYEFSACLNEGNSDNAD